LLKAINDDPKIRPYLREYPFTVPRVKVTISFCKLDGEPYTDGVVVGYVFQARGIIFYDKRAKNGSLSTLGEELYENALRIVQNPHLKLRHDFSKHWSKHPEVEAEDLNEEEQQFIDAYYKQTSQQRWEQLKTIAENSSRMTLSGGIRELIAGVGDRQFEDSLQKLAEMEEVQNSGEYIEYWDNGQIKVKGAFKNGWADGHIHGWYKSGCHAFKAYFNEGVKQGVHFAFFPIRTSWSGCNKQRMLRYNEKGKAHGEQATDYPTRSTESYMTYVNGIINGEMKIKNDYQEGPIEERLYDHGKLLDQKVYPVSRRPKKQKPLKAKYLKKPI
jgi:antitoxin component YwqK of YwqJK toxin-antitoxin module